MTRLFFFGDFLFEPAKRKLPARRGGTRQQLPQGKETPASRQSLLEGGWRKVSNELEPPLGGGSGEPCTAQLRSPRGADSSTAQAEHLPGLRAIRRRCLRFDARLLLRHCVAVGQHALRRCVVGPALGKRRQRQ